MAIQPDRYEAYTTTSSLNLKHHALCWKSIFAGLVISLMAMMAATALGVGLISSVTRGAIESESNGGNIAMATGIWLFLSVVISLLLGGFFAARSSRTVVEKVGGSHALVVASLFFIIMASGGGSMVSSVSSGLGGLAKGLGSGVTDLSQNPMIQDTINSSIPTENLKTDPKTFAQGLTTRLLRGDTDSAKLYFAYNTGMTAADVEARFTEMEARFKASAKVAGDRAAKILSGIGWTLFVTFLVGLAGAFGGGIWGASCNGKDPLEETVSRTAVRDVPVRA